MLEHPSSCWRAYLKTFAVLLGIFMGAYGIAQQSSENPQSEKTNSYFAFLITGKSAATLKPEELQASQVSHLVNFVKLHKAGTLMTAGPTNDPSMKIRGILVLVGESEEAVRGGFKHDPFIEGGFLKLELHPQKILHGKLRMPLDEEAVRSGKIELESASLILFEKGEKWPEADKTALGAAEARFRDWVRENAKNKSMGYVGWLNGESDTKAVLLVSGGSSEVSKQLIESCSLVTDGLLEPRSYVQLLAKGAIENAR